MSFAELGGDSLAVEEMLAALAEDGIDLDLAAAPTLAAFAVRVREQSGKQAADRSRGVMVTLREGDGVPRLDAAGRWRTGLSVHRSRPCFPPQPFGDAFQVRGLSGAAPDWSVRRAAKRYAGLDRATSGTGPVVLIGHSLGGLFAPETGLCWWRTQAMKYVHRPATRCCPDGSPGSAADRRPNCAFPAGTGRAVASLG